MWTSLLLLVVLSFAPPLHLQGVVMATEHITEEPPHQHDNAQTNDPVQVSTAGYEMDISVDWFPGLWDSNLKPERKEKQVATGEFKGTIGEYADMMESLEPRPLKPVPRTTGPETFSLITSDSLAPWRDPEAPPGTRQEEVTEGRNGTPLPVHTPPIPLSLTQHGASVSRPTPVLLWSSDHPEAQGFSPLGMPTSETPSSQLGSNSDTDRYRLDPPTTPHRGVLYGDNVLEDTGDQLQDFTEHLKAERAADTTVFLQEGLSPTNMTPFLDDTLETAATTCKTSNQCQSPFYPDDIVSNQSQHPILSLTPPLFVPLYSDWNSALATWGFAWEAHIYGVGSVFAALGLISVLCLLGLPLRCPPGSPYFTMLHLLLLATGGTRAFHLLYDAYSHQELLPALGSLLLSELAFPCLTSAFSLCFILLSLRSRRHLSLSLSLSIPQSALPRPCFLFFLSTIHFGASLGSIALFHVFPKLAVLLLLPQGVFILLCLLLPCSFLLFYCLVRKDGQHIQRLRDSEGEVTGSPVLMGHPSRCPFADAEEWSRAAGAGLGGALCLLGCGGFQLYGMLHVLGLGGVQDGVGFQPWPWWGYQLACRFCEVGVCLSLSVFGTHPIFFCCSDSNTSPVTKAKANPRPGSWARLPCASPSGEPNPALPMSPTTPSTYPWMEEKLVVCDVISNPQSESLPLYTLMEPPSNGLNLHHSPHPCQTRTSRHPNLPDPPSPPGRHQAGVLPEGSSQASLGMDTDSTVDLRPPSLIDLSRSIDQALYSETLFPQSIFSPPRLLHTSSSLSLNSPGYTGQTASQLEHSSADSPLYRTTSCGDVKLPPSSPKPDGTFLVYNNACCPPERWWRGSNSSSIGQGSLSGSSQGLFSTAGPRSHSNISRGQPTQSSLQRTLPHLSQHRDRRYRTLSSASQDSTREGRLVGTEDLTESRLLERDLAVQAEFVSVCRQIDALSVSSDTIDL
ncbi:hypothetical protein UPYG_G00265500 [Umbra pygmaea]|uniref:Proline-rich transmembrane protein 3/4 domain-containing protein n=1 Tax=Umbra pygmaea TaxID=75934 RepID=A0ABD0W9T3_UMBPY